MALYLLRKNKKVLITGKVIHRRALFSKGFGLMFHRKIKNEAHIFYFDKSFKIPLTMFFVFFPIDVVFLKDMVVVEIKKKFLPFTNFKSSVSADMFIELPSGFVDKKKIVVGSKFFLD